MSLLVILTHLIIVCHYVISTYVAVSRPCRFLEFYPNRVSKGLKFPNEVLASNQALTLTSQYLSIKHSSDNSVHFYKNSTQCPSSGQLN